MNSASRFHPVLLCAVLASPAFACGGAPSAGASSATSSMSTSSGAQSCLANAGMKRERKPSEPARITAKHVLVRYAGAKHSPATVTRTREQACLRAEEALAKLQGGMSFGDVVRDYSDESGAGGTIGAVERPDVAPAFADAAFELKAGEVSQVVESPFGFHVILRVE